jgi:hypothetical protein
MFIHGARRTSGRRETFADYFESRGYEVSAPEWPRKEEGVESLAPSSRTGAEVIRNRTFTVFPDEIFQTPRSWAEKGSRRLCWRARRRSPHLRLVVARSGMPSALR